MDVEYPWKDLWEEGSCGLLYSPERQDVNWSHYDGENRLDSLSKEATLQEKYGPSAAGSLTGLPDTDDSLDSLSDVMGSDMFGNSFYEESVDLDSLITQPFDPSKPQVFSAHHIPKAEGLNLSNGSEAPSMEFTAGIEPSDYELDFSVSDLAWLEQYPYATDPQNAYIDLLLPKQIPDEPPLPENPFPDVLPDNSYLDILTQPEKCYPKTSLSSAEASFSSPGTPESSILIEEPACPPEELVPLPVPAGSEAGAAAPVGQAKRKKRPYTKRTALTKESRKDRKKEQNKTAARRYRAKVKDEEGQLEAQLEDLQQENQKLKASIELKRQRLNYIMEIKAKYLL